MTPAAVIGMGACTAAGLNVASCVAAVRAGVSGFHEHPYLLAASGAPVVAAIAPHVGEEDVLDRCAALAADAAREALRPLQPLNGAKPRVAMMLGLPEARPGVNALKTRELAARVSAAVEGTYHVEMSAFGHSAGILALRHAVNALSGGGREFCLAGGVDSYISPDTIEWLEATGQFHSEDNSWGFTPGEGAGFCLLASAETAARYHLPVLGRILSVSPGRERNLIKTQSVCIGEGLSEAVSGALRALPPGGRIARTVCDLNGERYRSDEWGFTLVRNAEFFADSAPTLTPADCWGDVGAASGPLFAALALAPTLRGRPPGYSLLFTSSEAGDRAAAVAQAAV